MTDPYYVPVARGDYRAVGAVLRASRAGRLQGLRLWVRDCTGPLARPWALYPWDVEDAAGYWLRATRGDYAGPDGRAMDAIVGYSHRDHTWLGTGA